MVILCCLLLLAPEVGAVPPDDVARAAALHEQAKAVREKAARRPSGAQALQLKALELWQAAESLHAHPRYAINVGLVQLDLERWLPAWTSAQRANTYHMTAEESGRYASVLADIEARASEVLRRTHALAELTVVPDTATVILDSNPWSAPRRRWVVPGESTLRVEAPGHVPHERTWSHSVGGVHRLTVTLEPEVAVVVPPEPPPSNPIGFWKWVTLGVASAAVVGVVTAYVVQDGVLADQEALHASNPSPADYPSYLRDYETARADFDSAGQLGMAMAATAFVAGGTTVVLFLLDRGTDNTSRVQITPLGLGLSVQTGF